MTTLRFDFCKKENMLIIFNSKNIQWILCKEQLKDLNWEMRRRRLCFPLVSRRPSHSLCPASGKLTSAFPSDEETSGMLEVRTKLGKEAFVFSNSWYSGILRLFRPDLCPRRLENINDKKNRFLLTNLFRIDFTWLTSGCRWCPRSSG